MTLINDEHRLVSVQTRFGNAIKTYDGGSGPLWIAFGRTYGGIKGIVRAQTWEEAYEICQNEIFPEAGVSMEDMVREFGENWSDNPAWKEQYKFRPNGGIYTSEPSGEYLIKLTVALATDLELHIIIKPCE